MGFMSNGSSLRFTAPVAALHYNVGAYPDALFAALVATLKQQGIKLAGVIQHEISRPDCDRCDMGLEDLTTGALIGIFEDRGPEARGCRIDQHRLLEAASLVSQAMNAARPDLIIINKFGKVEGEGGGLRDIIAEAVSCDIPVLIGIPPRNRAAWEAFAGEFSAAFSLNDDDLLHWLRAKTGALVTLPTQHNEDAA